jgi:hypothetical protein
MTLSPFHTSSPNSSNRAANRSRCSAAADHLALGVVTLARVLPGGRLLRASIALSAAFTALAYCVRNFAISRFFNTSSATCVFTVTAHLSHSSQSSALAPCVTHSLHTQQNRTHSHHPSVPGNLIHVARANVVNDRRKSRRMRRSYEIKRAPAIADALGHIWCPLLSHNGRSGTVSSETPASSTRPPPQRIPCLYPLCITQYAPNPAPGP